MKRLMMLLVAGLLAVPAVGWAANPPDGTWNEIRSGTGVKMYQKGSDIVQIVRLDQGARVKFYQVQDESDPDVFQKFGLLTAWANFQQIHSNYFSFCNGQFFADLGGPVTRLSFSLRADDEFLTGGSEMSTYTGEKMGWWIWGSETLIKPVDDNPLLYLNSSAPDAVTGLHGLADKEPNNATKGRTFIGVDDLVAPERYRTILIFTSSGCIQQHAINQLNAFGADQIMMLDGGGSTQLRVPGTTLIDGDGRLLPHFIGVLEGDNTSPTTPTNLTVNPSGCNQTNSFTFNWGAATDNESGIRGYRYKVGVSGAITPPTNQSPLSASTFSIGPGGFAPGTGNHVFYLYAENGVGLLSQVPAQVGFCYQPPTGPCGTREIPRCWNPPHGPDHCIPPASAQAIPKQ